MVIKKSNEAVQYAEDKHRIFTSLLAALESAIKNNEDKIYIKNLKILEEEVDVIATKEEWPTVLHKALIFFENLEDYEMCRRCKNIQDKILT